MDIKAHPQLLAFTSSHERTMDLIRLSVVDCLIVKNHIDLALTQAFSNNSTNPEYRGPVTPEIIEQIES